MDEQQEPDVEETAPTGPSVKLWSGRAPLWIEKGKLPDWEAPRGPGERVLAFPRRRSLGVLYGTYWNRRLPGPIDGGWWKIGPARGKVTVPVGNQVWLAVNPRAVSDLSPLADLEPNALRVISFEGTSVENDHLRHLGGLTGLYDLRLYETDISDEGLAHLRPLRNLRRLDLSWTEVMDEGLRHLSSLRQLRRLHLHYTEVRGPGLASLEQLPHLAMLGLTDTPIDDETVRHLLSLRHLTSLELELTEITDAGLEHLASLSGLHYLGLRHKQDQITDAGMVHVDRLRNLRELDLLLTEVSDEGLRLLQGLTSLRHIELCGTFVSRAGVEAFRRALPRCRVCCDYDYLEESAEEQ